MKTPYVDTILCHDGGVQDPSVYIEGFEALIGDGCLRNYGISTNDLDVLKRFQEASGGNCAVVELDYSLLNREPETSGLIDYCREQEMGVLVRGPLHKGLLSGRYGLETEFTDTVREKWNPGGAQREAYERKLEDLRRIQEAMDETDLSQTALRFVIRHPANMVVIPGATRPDQVIANAAAGAELLDDERYRRLLGL